MPSTAAVVEEIVQEPTMPPQLLRTVIQRGEEFEMLEEREARSEEKKLRANLISMQARIEVSLRDFFVERKGQLICLPAAESDEGVRAVPAVA